MAQEFAPLSSMVYGASPLRGSLIQADRHIKMLNDAGKTQDAEQYYRTVADQISAIGAARSQAEVNPLLTGLNTTLTGLNAYTSGIAQSMQERSEEQEGVDKERQKVAQGISASLSLANIEGVGVDQRKTQLAYELIEKGDLAGAKVIQSNLADSIKSAIEMKKQQRNELEGQRQAIQGSDDLAAKIDRFITPEGKMTPILDDATGFGEGAGTFLGKMTGGVVGNEPRTISAQQVLNRIVEKDLLEASKYLKPVSDDEMKMLKKNRPQITDPPEVWVEYLGDIRAVLERDKKRWQQSVMELAPPSSSQAQSTSEQTTPDQQPTTQLQNMNNYFQRFNLNQ